MMTKSIEHHSDSLTPNYGDYFSSNQTTNFLETEGVDIDYARRLPANQRPEYLIKQLFIPDEIKDLPERALDTAASINKGLIIIKPELAPFQNSVTSYLARLGLSPSVGDSLFLSKEEWLALYGYMIPQRPEIVNMYVSHRALGVTPIIFDHLNVTDYVETKRNYQYDAWIPENTHDVNYAFDQLFCGSATDFSPGTIRWEVTRKKLASTSLLSVTNDSVVFDPVAYYADGHKSEIPYAFNGVHVPKNNSETYHNLKVIKYEK